VAPSSSRIKRVIALSMINLSEKVVNKGWRCECYPA
jgi:hypothetical protein